MKFGSSIRQATVRVAKGITSGLVLCSLASVASAQSVEGPFASESALLAYWSGSSSPNQMTNVYLNGKLIFNKTGFTPQSLRQYFACRGTGEIRLRCSSHGDGDRQLSYIAAYFPYPHHITLDGAPYQTGGPGGAYADINRCYTSDTLGTYYRLGTYTGFTPAAYGCY